MLWKISRANLLLMIADQSNVKSVKKEEKEIKLTGADFEKRFKR